MSAVREALNRAAVFAAMAEDRVYDAVSDAQDAIQAHEQEEAKRKQEVAALVEALKDALSGWRYIRATHGDLYGVGWDRVEQKACAALRPFGDEK